MVPRDRRWASSPSPASVAWKTDRLHRKSLMVGVLFRIDVEVLDGNRGPIGFLKEAFVKSVRKKDANVPGNRSLFFVSIGSAAVLGPLRAFRI
jgi:hypothetical protein